MTSTQDNSFINLNDLSYLILSNNRISKLNNNAFSNLNFLASLDLSYNRICNFTSSIVEQLTYLLDLNLSHNLINSIDIEEFKNLSNYGVVDLNNNPIISCQKYKALIELNVIDYKNHNIDCINDDY